MKVNHRKEQIVQSARSLFLKKGYENTSVDEVIADVGIAKGTFYYYFKSKEQLLEAVIEDMEKQMKDKAFAAAASSLPPYQKTAAVLACFRPELEEGQIIDVLHEPENLRLHQRINERIVEDAGEVMYAMCQAPEFDGLVNRENLSERIKITLILSQNLFDDGKPATKEQVDVFLEVVENTLGAKEGSLSFLRSFIGG